MILRTIFTIMNSIAVMTDDSERDAEEFDYILMNDAIRKGTKSMEEPEFIVYVDKKGKFRGLFKLTHVNDGENPAVGLWERVY